MRTIPYQIAVMGCGVRDFVSDNSRQPSLVLRDGKNPCVDADLAAGETERVWLFALEHDKLPVRIRKILLRHCGDALSDPNRHARAKVLDWNEEGFPEFGEPE